MSETFLSVREQFLMMWQSHAVIIIYGPTSLYHDQNPPLRKFQDFFSRMILNPAEKKTFNKIVNVRGAKLPVDAMIIANNRAKNLGDLFSIRNIEKKPGPPVSSYLW